MAILRCKNGHYYDDERFVTCPHCGVQIPETANVEHSMQDQKTIKMDLQMLEEEIDLGLLAPFEERTLRAVALCETVNKAANKAYTVGWLVCINGPKDALTNKCSFELKSGFNWIRRLRDLDDLFSDIDNCRIDDEKVSREKHCAVVYEPVNKQFFLVPGTGNLVYRNEVMVNGVCELKNGDQFQVGDSVLELIVFCREGHSWEDFE